MLTESPINHARIHLSKLEWRRTLVESLRSEEVIYKRTFFLGRYRGRDLGFLLFFLVVFSFFFLESYFFSRSKACFISFFFSFISFFYKFLPQMCAFISIDKQSNKVKHIHKRKRNLH